MPRRNNPHAHLTAKDRDRPSFPTRKLLSLGHIQGRVLDFGCGHGVDVAFLRAKGFDVVGYDPHYAPDRPEGTFDTILCHYVLNVLLLREQTDVLMDISEYLKPTGSAFYSVRRDLRRVGFRRHYKHRVLTYQTNVHLPFETVVRTEFCEIYRYQPYPLVQREEETCLLCAPSPNRSLITESAQAYALSPHSPATEGHVIVVPKRHTPDYFELTEPEQTATWLVVNRVQSLLAEKYSPGGFTVGLDVGTAAGQSVPHAHVHVLPRYNGNRSMSCNGIQAAVARPA